MGWYGPFRHERWFGLILVKFCKFCPTAVRQVLDTSVWRLQRGKFFPAEPKIACSMLKRDAGLRQVLDTFVQKTFARFPDSNIEHGKMRSVHSHIGVPAMCLRLGVQLWGILIFFFRCISKFQFFFLMQFEISFGKIKQTGRQENREERSLSVFTSFLLSVRRMRRFCVGCFH